MARPTGRAVRDELIEAATGLIQSVGVKAFSYGDLAKQLDIKAPSIHHHFRVKEDLVAAVAATYRENFSHQVSQLDEPSHAARLQRYADLFARTASAGHLCLCGAVAADWLSVGAAPRQEVEAFFADQVQWLTEQVEAGVAGDEFRLSTGVNAGDIARTLFAALEGSMLMTRSGDQPELASSVGAVIVSLVTA